MGMYSTHDVTTSTQKRAPERNSVEETSHLQKSSVLS